jgi:phage tail-like protein
VKEARANLPGYTRHRRLPPPEWRPIMSPATRTDPYLAGNFLVSIDGIIAEGAFSEVCGLEASIDIVEYRSGNSPEIHAEKLPGLRKYTNITLKRGFTSDTSLWNWFKSVTNGNESRTTVKITLRDQADNPVLVWQLTDAWPCRWTGPALCADSSEVAIESIEICYEELILSLSAQSSPVNVTAASK